VLGHGEPAARQWMADALHARYPKLKIIQPEPGQAVGV